MALQQLADSDEPRARRAFDHLYAHYLSFAQSVLRRQFSACSATDVEHAAQQTFINLWLARKQIQVPDMPSWRGLLRKTIRNCYLDIVRAHKETQSLESLAQVPPDERVYALEIIEQLTLAKTVGLLTHAADVCWLGLALDLPEEEHNRRLLAAQMFYLEEAEVEEILDLFNRARPGERPLSHTTLADWLEEPAVLRQLAYTYLYFSPTALTLHLLNLPEETPPQALDLLLTTPNAKQDGLYRDWTPQEIHVLLWRYYRNASPQREPGIPHSQLTLEEQEQLFVRCRALFPFTSRTKYIMNITNGQLEEYCGPSSPGLWRRLAFQYRYLDDLAHQDIEERIAPAAHQVAVPVSQTVLQGWLSSRRLLTALAKTCASLFEESTNE